MKVEMYAFAVGCLTYVTDSQHRDKQIEVSVFPVSYHTFIFWDLVLYSHGKAYVTASIMEQQCNLTVKP